MNFPATGKSSGYDFYAKERNVVVQNSHRETRLDAPDFPSPNLPGFSKDQFGQTSTKIDHLANLNSSFNYQAKSDQFEGLYYQERTRAASLSKELESMKALQKKQLTETDTVKKGYEEFIRRLEAEMSQLKRSEERLIQMTTTKRHLELELERVSRELKSVKTSDSDEVVQELRRVIDRLMEEKKQLRGSLEQHQAEISKLVVYVNTLREEGPNESDALRSQLSELQSRFSALSAEYTHLRNTPIIAPPNRELEALLRERVQQIHILEARISDLSHRLRSRSQEQIYCRFCYEKDNTIMGLHDHVRMLETRRPVVREVVSRSPSPSPRVLHSVQRVLQPTVQTIVQPPIQKIVRTAPEVRTQRISSSLAPYPVQTAQVFSTADLAYAPAPTQVVSRLTSVPTSTYLSQGVTQYAASSCRCISNHGHCCCCEYGGFYGPEYRSTVPRYIETRRASVGPVYPTASLDPALTPRSAVPEYTVLEPITRNIQMEPIRRFGTQSAREIRTIEVPRSITTVYNPKIVDQYTPLPSRAVPETQIVRNASPSALRNTRLLMPEPRVLDLARQSFSEAVRREETPSGLSYQAPASIQRIETMVSPRLAFQPNASDMGRPFDQFSQGSTNVSQASSQPSKQGYPSFGPAKEQFNAEQPKMTQGPQNAVAAGANPFSHESVASARSPSTAAIPPLPPVQVNTVEVMTSSSRHRVVDEYGAQPERQLLSSNRQHKVIDHFFSSA